MELSTRYAAPRRWLESEIDAVLADFEWLHHPNFSWQYGLEGFHDFKFGSKLGPENDPWLIIHDAAHVVEFTLAGEVDRFVKGDFNFKLPYVYAFGREFIEPKTRQMTQRELRACAIQWYLTLGTSLEQPLASFIMDNAHVLRLQEDGCAWGRDDDTQQRNRAEYLHRCVRRYETLDLVSAWRQGMDLLTKTEH